MLVVCVEKIVTFSCALLESVCTDLLSFHRRRKCILKEECERCQKSHIAGSDTARSLNALTEFMRAKLSTFFHVCFQYLHPAVRRQVDMQLLHRLPHLSNMTVKPVHINVNAVLVAAPDTNVKPYHKLLQRPKKSAEVVSGVIFVNKILRSLQLCRFESLA